MTCVTSFLPKKVKNVKCKNFPCNPEMTILQIASLRRPRHDGRPTHRFPAISWTLSPQDTLFGIWILFLL